MTHLDRIKSKPLPPSDKQVAYLRTLLQTVGIIDPDHDPQWLATATKILARPVTTGALDTFTRSEVSSLIDACKRFTDEEAAKTQRIPAALVNPADDPWAVDNQAAPTDAVPTRIRFRGHDYVLVAP